MSTPSSSSSGNIIPASTTMMWPLDRKAIMCMPNSPSPPSGMTSSTWSVFIVVRTDYIRGEIHPPKASRNEHPFQCLHCRGGEQFPAALKMETYEGDCSPASFCGGKTPDEQNP